MNLKERLARRYAALPEPSLQRERTALLVVDMQYLDAHADYGLVARARERGLHEAVDYYVGRLRTVVPNTRRLIDAFRDRDMDVIYTVIESLLPDGRDRSLEHKRLDIFAAPGSKEAQVLDEIAPRAAEVVLKKTCGSVFNGTMLHYILRNLDVRALVVCGVVTNGCIESAVRDASNLSYEVVVAEDACATWTPEMHDASLFHMHEVFAKVMSTDAVIERLPSAPIAAGRS